jgi:hypothetical protein
LLDRLLKSVPVDNLYFGRAKELSQAIETGRISTIPPKSGNGGAKPGARSGTPDPYRTEH